ncbi:MAG: hypothetical protein IJ301_04445, partial [Clostridia bacterium]|nr:hypothetical protein [Clostridia bacterium]
ALLRVLEIKELQSYYGNKNKKPICVTFEKSSFGTVHSLDNNFTAHPLLKNAKDNIIEFFKKDDEAKRNYLLKNYETRQDLIENVNAYLKESTNVNQVGVSGNVQTEDNYFIYGKRADTAIDSNKLYPGVNGNAEVIDKNVKFYQSSMNVDFPSIKTDALRIEFCNELNREAEAELNLHLNENLWNSNGIVLSGFIPTKEQSDDYDTLSYRRMHFNFIFEQKISEKFFKVKKQADNAAEAYENKKLSGLEIEVKKNRFSVLVSSLKNGVNNLMKSKNIITSIFTILLFIGSASNLNLQSLFTLSNLSSIISFLFAGLMVIITVINIAEFIKKSTEKRKYTKKIIFIKNSNLSTQIKKRRGKFLKKQTYHPVFCVCLLTYIERKINGNKINNKKLSN